MVCPINVPQKPEAHAMVARESMSGKASDVQQVVVDLLQYAREAARDGEPIHAVEREVWVRVLSLGHAILARFIAEQGDGDLGETLVVPDGRELKRLEWLHDRTYLSIFGPLQLSRAVYGSRESQKIEFVPLDHRLQLPEGEYSYVLQDWCQVLDVEHAFARAAETLQTILGMTVPVDSLERMSRQMAAPVREFRLSRPQPPAIEEGELVVVTADNKGVPMRRPPVEKKRPGLHRKKGEKANKKQMATVGAVYTVAPKRRTAEEVVGALFGDQRPTGRKEDQPTAQHKRVWSSLNIEEEPHSGQLEVFEWMQSEHTRRNPNGDKVTVCLMDGQRTLWEDRQLKLPLENVIEILDLIHVLPRLWQAAHLFHREGSDEAEVFVRERLLRVLEGEVGYVIGGLRQMGTKRQLRGAKRQSLRRICQYLENNRDRLHYDEYLAAGYPIASGVIEGACRHLVKDRMERSGMRWTVPGAQAMLDLRSTYINGQWDEFQEYRITTETERLYPHAGLLDHVQWPLAA